MAENSEGLYSATRKLKESPSGLVVVQTELTSEMRRQRREDNKLAKAQREKTRRRKKHGRQ